MSRVLVIEDDISVRTSIIDLLTEEGFETIEAVNGLEGIGKAKSELPDLIISDILMPEANGYDVLYELQKEVATSTIPFIFLSARTEQSDIREGMNLGADDYLTKPYKANDLLKAVNSKLSKVKYIDKKLEDLHKNIAKALPHELRTPLVSVIGYSDLLKSNIDDLDKSEIIQMINGISEAGSHLLTLIQKFLLYTELEITLADRYRLKRVIENPSFLSREWVKTFAEEIIKKYLREDDFVFDIEAAALQVDHEHLRFIIRELVENACKFSKKGSPISIKAKKLEGKYSVEITDFGDGMNSEMIKRIGVLKQFDRGSGAQAGIGLSLAIINKIMKLYEGEFGIESSPGVFTTVKLYFKINESN